MKEVGEAYTELHHEFLEFDMLLKDLIQRFSISNHAKTISSCIEMVDKMKAKSIQKMLHEYADIPQELSSSFDEIKMYLSSFKQILIEKNFDADISRILINHLKETSSKLREEIIRILEYLTSGRMDEIISQRKIVNIEMESLAFYLKRHDNDIETLKLKANEKINLVHAILLKAIKEFKDRNGPMEMGKESVHEIDYQLQSLINVLKEAVENVTPKALHEPMDVVGETLESLIQELTEIDNTLISLHYRHLGSVRGVMNNLLISDLDGYVDHVKASEI